MHDEAPSHVSTTAGGDGLEFDSRVLTVYEEIKAIKGNTSLLPVPMKAI